MVIDETGLCAVMRDAFRKKSTGYKVAARWARSDADERELILSTPGFTAVISRENAPRKVLALIVEHMGDLPDEGMAFHVKDGDVQTEIFHVAVSEPEKTDEDPIVRRTKLMYEGYQMWQRVDNLEVFLVAPKFENLMDNYNREIRQARNGMFYVEGVASRLYVQPLEVKQNELTALHHLAKLKWA